MLEIRGPEEQTHIVTVTGPNPEVWSHGTGYKSYVSKIIL